MCEILCKPLSSSQHLQDNDTKPVALQLLDIKNGRKLNLLLFLQMWFMWPRVTLFHCMPCVSGQTRCNPLSCMMSFPAPSAECGSLSSLWLHWAARLRARWCFMKSRWVCRSFAKTHACTDKTFTLLHHLSHLLVLHKPSLTACCSTSLLRIWEGIFCYYADASSLWGSKWIVSVYNQVLKYLGSETIFVILPLYPTTMDLKWSNSRCD